MGKTQLNCIVNGEPVSRLVEEHQSLLHFLREELALTGTKEGCGEGDCGACTVVIDGQSVNSCLYLAHQAEGREIVTIEGIAKDQELGEIQNAFIEFGAIQCGFCSPGMVMSTKALLDDQPKPTEEEIRRGLSGNLCRCTGYQAIIDAVKSLGE